MEQEAAEASDTREEHRLTNDGSVKRLASHASTNPKVSIILPAFNEETEIRSAIDEMERQSYPNREIIVIDDGSTDDTVKVAREYSREMADVSVIETTHSGPSHARNSGVAKSSGEIIFFGECDCVYDAEYLERAVKSLVSNPRAGAVCLTGAPLVTKRTLATDSIDLENKVQHKLLRQGRIKPFYAWVYRRDVLLRVGGFDETLFQAEDRDLFGRVVASGYEVQWVPGINWRHKRNENLSQLALKWYRRGRTRVLYSLKHKSVLDFGKSVLPFWALVVGVVLSVSFELIGGVLLIAFVACLILAQSLRMTIVAWSEVGRKWVFAGYPLFLATRNFSTALGYTVGTMLVLRNFARGRELTHDRV